MKSVDVHRRTAGPQIGAPAPAKFRRGDARAATLVVVAGGGGGGVPPSLFFPPSFHNNYHVRVRVCVSATRHNTPPIDFFRELAGWCPFFGQVCVRERKMRARCITTPPPPGAPPPWGRLRRLWQPRCMRVGHRWFSSRSTVCARWSINRRIGRAWLCFGVLRS